MLENSKEKNLQNTSRFKMLKTAIGLAFIFSLSSIYIGQEFFNSDLAKVEAMSKMGDFQLLKNYNSSNNFEFNSINNLEMRLARKEMFELHKSIASMKNANVINEELKHMLYKDANGNEINDVFINGQVNKKYREKYEKIKYLATLPITVAEKKEYEDYYNKLVEINKSVQKSSEKSSFKRNFQREVNELSLFFVKTSNENMNGLDVVNIMRQNYWNKDFKNLVEENKYEELWKQYFENSLGKEIHPIILNLGKVE